MADSVVIPRLNSWGLGKRTPKNRIRRTWCPGVRVAIRGRPCGPAAVFGGELGRSSLGPLPRVRRAISVLLVPLPLSSACSACVRQQVALGGATLLLPEMSWAQRQGGEHPGVSAWPDVGPPSRPWH